MHRLTIRSTILLFGAIVGVGILAAVAVSLLAINQIKVGGPTYNQIIQGKDLVADILPPPAYVIESYLEATLALNRSKPLPESRSRLKVLKDQYDERRRHWIGSDLKSSIKTNLTETSHSHVTAFWQAIEQDLLPALERKDQTAIDRAYAKVTQAYERHRRVIDGIVTETEAMNEAVERETARQSSIVFMWILGAVVTVIMIVLGGVFAINKGVVAPLRKMQEAMLKLAGGDFGVVIPGATRKDEIGDMANAVEKFKVLAIEKGRQEAEEGRRRQQAEAELQAKAAEERARAAEEQGRAIHALGIGLGMLSDGDLTIRLSEGFGEGYTKIKDDFNTAVERLHETISAIDASAREVSSASVETSTSTGDLSQRTEEQAASLEETSAAMEQISSAVKTNAENARQANQLTAGTHEYAERGGAVVEQAVHAMSRIEQSSTKISDIIGVIDEIARQTNLLALNAAVEAARAGDAGRGFAVVASEVRSLAQRSSEAAKDIKSLIVNSTTQVQEGVDLVNRAGQSLEEIVGSIKQVATIVSEIASASTEQSSGIDQINVTLNQMDEMTQQNAALVEQNAATSKVLEQQSAAMTERVAFFKLGGDAASASAARTVAAPAFRSAA